LFKPYEFIYQTHVDCFLNIISSLWKVQLDFKSDLYMERHAVKGYPITFAT